MTFDPLEQKGIPICDQTKEWSMLNVRPYDKDDVHPYTRCRIILMNGAEMEAQWFSHQFARHTADIGLKRQLAETRRLEQQQQKMVAGLVPANESVLEHTIGYEQVAVDLTAGLARSEPDPLVKSALDFALLEDFDHLYRYANLLDMTTGKKAEEITGGYTEITVGRPTKLEHRHPFDEIRQHYDHNKADILTQLHVMTIVAAEQQTMNFYNNVANQSEESLGRGLYQEIAQVEEQHVTHYESLLDPTSGWLERWCLHEYNECYLYWSCMESETDTRIKRMWEEHLNMEIDHLHQAARALREGTGKEARDMLPAVFPSPTVFASNIDYIRDIEEQQVGWTGNLLEYVPADSLSKDHRYWRHQRIVNAGGAPSDDIVERHIRAHAGDYRQELGDDHPIKQYRKAS